LGVSIRGTALLLIAQAPVEIFATLLVASEIGAALGEQIVDERGRQSVEPLHELLQIRAGPAVANQVVMIAHDRYEPEEEFEFIAVMLQPLLDNLLGLLRFQRRKIVPTATGDEVDLVVHTY
jgi:hypothetical protein